MKKSIILISALALTTLFSCKKDDETKTNKDYLTSHTWTPSSYAMSVEGTNIDTPAEDCEKDDKLSFSADMKYIFNPGDVICEDDEVIETGTYTLSSDQKTITFDGEVWTITSISDSQLVLSMSMEGMTMKMTLVK